MNLTETMYFIQTELLKEPSGSLVNMWFALYLELFIHTTRTDDSHNIMKHSYTFLPIFKIGDLFFWNSSQVYVSLIDLVCGSFSISLLLYAWFGYLFESFACQCNYASLIKRTLELLKVETLYSWQLDVLHFLFFFFSVDLVPYKLDLDLRFSGYRITATSTREVSDFCLSRYLRLVQVNLTSSYDDEFVQFILILLTPFIMTVSTWFAFFFLCRRFKGINYWSKGQWHNDKKCQDSCRISRRWWDTSEPSNLTCIFMF